VRILYSLLLVGVTVVWGWTFVVVQDAIAPYGVCRISLQTLMVGGGIGIALALGYLFQTTGLLFTNPTNSGLITGLFVVFAPLADRLIFGVRFSWWVLVAVVLSLFGMILLVGGGPDGANLGDLLTLLCAAALGLHIALLSRYTVRYDTTGLAFAQVLSVALIFGVFWPFFEPVAFPPQGVWLALGATGLVASAGAFWVQTFVQQRIPAVRTAVILTMEPVFAALFGYWLAGDRLVALHIFGAALILSALLVCEVLPVLSTKRSRKKKAQEKGDLSS
jgi:drug/metabolite transporter (DMT)-like permease